MAFSRYELYIVNNNEHSFFYISRIEFLSALFFLIGCLALLFPSVMNKMHARRKGLLNIASVTNCD